MKNKKFSLKSLLSKIKQFFFNLWHWKEYRQFKSYERKLRKGILDRETEKIKLLIEAKRLIPKKERKGISQYIPFSPTTKAEIKAIILFEFGYKMKALGMKITDDLKFI